MGISIWQLLIILAVVVLIFGTKKLKNLGGDVGSAVKGFKSAMKDGDDDQSMKKQIDKDDGADSGNIIEGEVNKDKDKV